MGRTRIRGIELAGVRLAIEVPSSLKWDWPNDQLRAFECAPHDPDLSVGVRIGSASLPGSDSILYECGGVSLEVGRDGGDWVAAVHGRQRYERVARFDEAFTQGEVVVAPGVAVEGGYPLAHPLDELILLHRLSRAGGLILQGSAVLREGRALVFVGSDDSPPTHERGAASRRLATSRVVLRPDGDSVRVHGTPWSSAANWNSPASAKLDAVHAMSSVRAVFAERLRGDSAATELLGHVFAPVHDPGGADRWLAAAQQIAERVPVLRLGMPREERVVPFTWGQRHAALAFAPPFLS